MKPRPLSRKDGWLFIRCQECGATEALDWEDFANVWDGYDDDLKPETVVQLDGGARVAAGWHWDAAGRLRCPAHKTEGST